MITHHQHFKKQMAYLFIHGGYEIGNGRKMGPAVGRQGHEHNVFFTTSGDSPA